MLLDMICHFFPLTLIIMILKLINQRNYVMKNVVVPIDSLQKKLVEMSEEGMELVEITFHKEQLDQDILSPAFLYFVALKGGELQKDFDSIDTISEYIH